MSCIIDQTLNSCQNTFQRNNYKTLELFNHAQSLQLIKKELNSSLDKLDVDYLIDIIQAHFTDATLFSKIIFKNVGLKFYDFLVTLSLNTQQRTVQVQVTATNSTPYIIQSVHQRILACKLFSKNSCRSLLNKVIISIQNGSFKVVGPLFMSNNQNFIDIFKNKEKSLSILTFLKQSINYGLSFIKPLLKMCESQLFSNQQKSSPSIVEKQNKINKLLVYINRSTIMPVFDVSLRSAKFQTVQTLSNIQQQKVCKIVKNICTNLQQFHSQKLYTYQFYNYHHYKKLDFTFTQLQINKIKQKLAFPKQNKSLIFNQNKYIYNTIEFNQQFPINFRKIASGGFGDIQIAEVQFWHMITISGGKMRKIQQVRQSQNKKNSIKKMLAFKSSNAKDFEVRDRLQHESKIISRLKGAECPFFCQYFKVDNQKSPFNKFLIMEYIHYPTMGQYLKNNLQSISFMTKLHFCNLIAQSIRFLTFYDVVHLDIKPDNILIYKKLMIKLIDFGQSYCPEICDKTFHKPAFSMPYGSPQIFSGVQTQFTQKSDTYSLGIIMFQIFFKRLPYVFAKQKVISTYKNRLYLQHLYYVPQQSAKYGESQIMKIIQNIIIKCLDPDIQKRPHALWLSLVLRQSLNYLINYETGNF